MPQPLLDNTINVTGFNVGWCKAHACPCTVGKATGSPGSPNPNCNTCFGRGTYWDDPVPFIGEITFMHTSAAPDENGVESDSILGRIMHGAPTLSIPYTNKDGSLNTVWAMAGEKDAYVETDASTRYQALLVTGQNTFLPYRQNINILDVTAYDPINEVVQTVSSLNYSVSGAVVTLNPAVYPEGTGYVVDYTASPVYIGWRRSGGIVHTRPAGQGANLPKRFHIETLDVWTRTLNNVAALGSPI